MMSALILVQLAMAPAQSLQSYDPPPAEAWEQSLMLRCGNTTLQIAGYGAARPLNRAVQIRVNGRPLAGAGAEALRRDLSNRRAAYRLAGRCPRQRSSIALIIHRGEQEAGVVHYSVGSGLIVNGRLDNYRGVQPANAESFWFR